jgi:hypothetical protein
MRARSSFHLFILAIALTMAGCTKPPANTDNSNNGSGPSDQQASDGSQSSDAHRDRRDAQQEAREQQPPPQPQPLVVPAGTSITISLGSALGSKLSQSGSTFTGSVARDIFVGQDVAIPRGSNVSGTVTDAKRLGRFAGGAVLSVRLDSINLNGADTPVQTSVRTFTAKGKGKRTAEIAGGAAALGGIIGAIAGGGKGAAIGLAAGGGAGAGGAALTGNKDILLPAESAVSFELLQPLEIQR